MDYNKIQQVRFIRPREVSFSAGEGYSSAMTFEITPPSEEAQRFLAYWHENRRHLSVLFEHATYKEDTLPGSHLFFSGAVLNEITPKESSLELLVAYASGDFLSRSDQFCEPHITL